MTTFPFGKVYQRNPVLLLFICITAIYLCYQIASYSRFIIRNLKQIVQTSEEQRKGRTYDSIGYDYIKYIISILPEPRIFPIIRYINYPQNIDIVFPENIKSSDPRVLIGINIPEEDLNEWVITTAHRLKVQTNVNKDYWAFNTIHDYDTLTAFRFIMDDTAFISPMKIILYENASEKKILGSWTFQPDNDGVDQTIFQLPTSIAKFSFNRGSEDFIITLESLDLESVSMLSHIEYIELYGIKVDLGEYQIVQKKGKNFTAMTNEFLHSIERDNMTEWKQFLTKIRQ